MKKPFRPVGSAWGINEVSFKLNGQPLPDWALRFLFGLALKKSLLRQDAQALTLAQFIDDISTSDQTVILRAMIEINCGIAPNQLGIQKITQYLGQEVGEMIQTRVNRLRVTQP